MGMRRAATAEAEAEQLRVSLMEAQKQAKDLGWQARFLCKLRPAAEGPELGFRTSLGFKVQRGFILHPLIKTFY